MSAVDGHVVEVRDLHCRYGDFEALRGVTLCASAGDVLAVLGPNGAGKTTLLETLEGLRPPTSGTVRVFGQDPFTSRAVVRRRTGVMLQQNGFFGELTVAETVDSWRRFITGAAPRDDVLARVDLVGKSRVRVRQLSGGESRRLDLALALLGSPELLFLDEPTTGLDPQARRRTWDVISSLARAGTTVILSTHYLEEAEHLASHVSLLCDGRIVRSGTLPEVLSTGPGLVTLPLRSGCRVEDLPTPAGVEFAVRDGQACWTGSRVDVLVSALTDWSIAAGADLSGMQVRTASLEDVFIQVTEASQEEVPT